MIIENKQSPVMVVDRGVLNLFNKDGSALYANHTTHKLSRMKQDSTIQGQMFLGFSNRAVS